MSIVPIISGGLDSITMLYELRAMERKFHGAKVEDAVSFNYGQRHKKELEFAVLHCNKLGVRHHVIDLHAAGLSDILANSTSSLVNQSEDIPEGHYAAENMKSTVVPNRNMMMIAIAGSIAGANGAGTVAIGVHAGDHFIYPDCRSSFIGAIDRAMRLGNEGFGANAGTINVYAPFAYISKADIAFKALALEVPIHQTWSCYKGGTLHCGKCGTCVERIEALHDAVKGTAATYEQADTTVYEDPTYWRTAVKVSN